MTSIRHKLLLWLLPGLGILWGAAGTAIYLTVEAGLEAQLDAELRALTFSARFSARPPGSGPPPDRMRDAALAAFNDPEGDVYFLIRNREGEIVAKSISLGERTLPIANPVVEDGSSYDAVMQGNRVRVWSAKVPFSPRGRGRGRGGPPWERIEEFPRVNDLRELEEFLGRRPGPAPDRDRDGKRGFGHQEAGGGRGGERRGPDMVDIVVAKDRTAVDRTLATLLGGVTFSGVIAAFASVLLIRFALQSGLRPLESVGEAAAKIDARNLQARFAADQLPDEIRPIASKLNELMGRLEAGFERERRFSADLAHELRTPVAELKSMAEVAIKWPEQASDENYEDLREISDRMQATIENLLMLARLEKSPANSIREKIKLADFCEQHWKPLAMKAKERELDVRFDVARDRVAESDPQLLGIIVSNLFSNAVEYAPAQSCITVKAPGESKAALLSVSNPASKLKADDLEHLCERLWRKDSSRTDGSHSGLGLALADSCAQVLGLSLKAELSDGRLTVSIANATA